MRNKYIGLMYITFLGLYGLSLDVIQKNQDKIDNYDRVAMELYFTAQELDCIESRYHKLVDYVQPLYTPWGIDLNEIRYE